MQKTIHTHCVHCHKPLPLGKQSGAMYCGLPCRDAASKARALNARPYKVAQGTVGAIGELIVCTDLMKRGYDVYRALSQSCPCDLVAIRDGSVTRVEVKSVQWTLDGNRVNVSISERQRNACDVVAFVTLDEKIYYEPQIES